MQVGFLVEELLSQALESVRLDDFFDQSNHAQLGPNYRLLSYKFNKLLLVNAIA